MKVTFNGLPREADHVAELLPGRFFCGIGVCFGCVVEINGTPEVRACRHRLADGDTIRTTS
ncbi:2Fe-2S iron-sulfur cluster-binding protein [Lentzea sp. NPDC042327]|uniref:2Fe-2S iron-sulfur cluster-binding protein n=1 Tax=Lentzea sp. NPDC042327 TaxID=3154801 RepID=UPI0033C17550